MVKIGAEEEIKVKWIIGVYYTAFVAVVIYVIVDCVLSHRYAAFSEPVTFRSPWVVGDRSWRGEHANYWCSNASYDWPLPPTQYIYEGPHNLTNVSCAWLDNVAIANFFSDASIGFPTFFEQFRDDSIVPDPYFVTDIDNLIVNLNHGFNHPVLGTKPLPETIVYDVDGNEFMHFKKNDLFVMTLPQILQATKANLDAITPTLPDLGVAATTYRHAGVYILMTFSYTNFEPNIAKEKIVCRVTFEIVDKVWGVIATQGTREYHGVKLLTTGTGSVGSFSMYVLGVYIINTVVLLGIAEVFARQAYMMQNKLRAFCGKWAEEIKDSDDDADEKPTVGIPADESNCANENNASGDKYADGMTLTENIGVIAEDVDER